MGALQVDPFTRGIGCQEHLNLGVMPERLLRLHALLAAHATVDDDDGFPAAKEGGDAALQVVQRVAVFGKEDELLPR